jgi:hypothetical protein
MCTIFTKDIQYSWIDTHVQVTTRNEPPTH